MIILSIHIFLLTFFLVDGSNSSLQEDKPTNKSNQDFMNCSPFLYLRMAQAINEKRWLQGVPPLVLDTTNKDLVEYVQRFVDQGTGKPEPPVRPPIAFSQFYGVYPKTDSSPEEDIRGLYAMGDDYPYYGQEPPPKSLYPYYDRYYVFTQLIWAASRRVFIACSDYGDYRHMLVAFLPPGNIKGEYVRNVRRPREGKNDLADLKKATNANE